MPPFRNGNRSTRERARVVCEQCHSRKVRCDLEVQSDAICSNCRRLRHTCRRRDARFFQFPAQQGWPIASISATDHSLLTQAPVPQDPTPVEGSNMTSVVAQHSPLPAVRLGSKVPSVIEPERPSYLGERSLMSCSPSSLANAADTGNKFGEIVNDEFLKATGALSLPPRKMIEALAESYFKLLFHRMAIVDKSDVLVGASPLVLSQGVCLAGSLLRHKRSSSLLESGEVFYIKAKTLLSIGYEKDNLTVLQSLCLLSLWNVPPATVVSLDGSWHWLGMAMRLALQMGIHRDSTCVQMPKPGLTRRIAWFLFVQDKFQAAYYGRPPGIQHRDFNVRPLQLDDFEVCNEQAEIYIEYVKLGTFLGRMVRLQEREAEAGNVFEEAVEILNSLGSWVSSLPQNIRLFDAAGQKHYRRNVYEVHIIYFGLIILFFHFCGHAIPSTLAPLTALIASSSMARLYEEMDWRDDTNSLLSIHHWLIMAAALPQIHCSASIYDSNALCTEELAIFTTLLGQALTKWPTAESILKKINLLRSAQVVGTPQASLGDCEANHDNIPASTISALFPFPDSLCPRMTLLEQITSQQEDFMMEAARVLRDDDWDRIMAEFLDV